VRLARSPSNVTTPYGARRCYYTPHLIGGCIKRRCASDVCLSVAYIGPKSRTERHRKTKIGTEVAHVTRDSDTTIKIKRSKVKNTRLLYSPPCWHVRQLQRWAWERAGREKLLLRCRLLGRARRFGVHGGRRGAGACRGGRSPTACYYYYFFAHQHKAAGVKTKQKQRLRRLLRPKKKLLCPETRPTLAFTPRP